MSEYITFGQCLRTLRKEAGISQRKLAELSGIDFTYVSKMENNKLEHFPSVSTIRKIAEVVNADVEELLELAGKTDKVKLVRLEQRLVEFHALMEQLVQTNGEAHCYDRYCRDDEWAYCIFCEEGDFDPYEKAGWEHKPDCLVVRARFWLDRTVEMKGNGKP